MQRQIDIAKRLDVPSLIALSLVAIGWFGMNTLVISVGRLVQATRFYEVGVVILHPAALFLGVGSGHTFELTAFALLALLTLFAAMAAPVLFARRCAWLAGWAPLVLMLVCAALLYGDGSSPPPPAADPGLRGDLMRFANQLLQHAQDTLVSHISVGAGGILSALASLIVAVRSTRRFRVESPEVAFAAAPSYGWT
ncbi:MAG TPA: hypothetical protein VNZ06_04020 [Steroidobacteraceae bacterium]|jgi:hypothetical protein|nr:hypothetical protein [Steroidobacteraceae bacterium]